MRRIHVLNPAAGKGHDPAFLDGIVPEGDEIYTTTGIGDAERYISSVCSEDPGEVSFVVYGGDGTLNEAVNGILKAGAGDRAVLSVVPSGTGNDFVRTISAFEGETRVDAVKYNGRYAVNIINMGFDCSVVDKTQKYKTMPAVSGSMAYIMGVADVLFHKLGEKWQIELENENGEREILRGEYLLCLIANGQYYGGGFKPAPAASLTDGLLDVLIVSKVSRVTFLRLVSDYRKGTHIDENGEVVERFRKFVTYRRAKKVKVSGLKFLCADGEIEPTPLIEAEIVPNALRVLPLSSGSGTDTNEKTAEETAAIS